jgi:hypothetical protein
MGFSRTIESLGVRVWVAQSSALHAIRSFFNSKRNSSERSKKEDRGSTKHSFPDF